MVILWLILFFTKGHRQSTEHQQPHASLNPTNSNYYKHFVQVSSCPLNVLKVTLAPRPPTPPLPPEVTHLVWNVTMLCMTDVKCFPFRYKQSCNEFLILLTALYWWNQVLLLLLFFSFFFFFFFWWGGGGFHLMSTYWDISCLIPFLAILTNSL